MYVIMVGAWRQGCNGAGRGVLVGAEAYVVLIEVGVGVGWEMRVLRVHLWQSPFLISCDRFPAFRRTGLSWIDAEKCIRPGGTP